MKKSRIINTLGAITLGIAGLSVGITITALTVHIRDLEKARLRNSSGSE